MAKIESPYCPECDDAFDFPAPPSIDRRNFLRATAVGAATLATGATALADTKKTDNVEPKRKDREAETLIKELFSGLKDEQKKKVVFDYDHKDKGQKYLTRKRMFNAPVFGNTHRLVDTYSKAQQELVEKIAKSLSSGDTGYRQISRLGTWDASGSFERTGAVFFGEPTKDNKYAFVFAGHHLTIRCDGDTEEGPAFGGPIYYGHTPNGWSRGNCFQYQSRAVKKLYEALDGKQQKLATVTKRDKGEQTELEGSVNFRKEENCRGIRAGDLSKDQLGLAEEVMKAVLSPYRKEDVDEVMAIVKKNGGMEKVRFGFYPEGAKEEAEPWSFWRLEGPGFVWNFRVLPHVHTYVNISSKLS